VPIPKEDSLLMKMEKLTLNGPCPEKTFLPRLWKGSRLMPTPKDEVPKSSAGLGRVLIVSEDPMVQDFLAQMLGLLGYDHDSLQEWPKVILKPSWQRYDALFMESQFLEQFKLSKGGQFPYSPGSPLVVVLGDLPPMDEAGIFRVLKKPLDYRQMGRVMDECFSFKMQGHVSQDDEESERDY